MIAESGIAQQMKLASRLLWAVWVVRLCTTLSSCLFSLWLNCWGRFARAAGGCSGPLICGRRVVVTACFADRSMVFFSLCAAFSSWGLGPAAGA